MKLEKVLANFDYQVQCDDFLLYELGRLIEEDRASLDDEEFREIVDDGIHEHVEARLELRADIARRLRLAMPDIAEDDRAAASARASRCGGYRFSSTRRCVDPDHLHLVPVSKTRGLRLR